ncbi:MAG: hypothetical protein SFV17_23040 [Candidatus Obscuribacter sp.]|nr:hypothetical protein [Candidatus Obscuribacter sp.]
MIQDAKSAGFNSTTITESGAAQGFVAPPMAASIFQQETARLAPDTLRKEAREREAAQAREKARTVLLEKLQAFGPLPEHIDLALEAVIWEMTDKAPRAEYLAELLLLFLAEEKVVFAQVLGLLLKDAGIKVGYWRGEVTLSRYCQESRLALEVKITSTSRVVMKSEFTDLAHKSADGSCCSVVDNLTFLNLCVHVWQVFGA